MRPARTRAVLAALVVVLSVAAVAALWRDAAPSGAQDAALPALTVTGYVVAGEGELSGQLGEYVEGDLCSGDPAQAIFGSAYPSVTPARVVGYGDDGRLVDVATPGVLVIFDVLAPGNDQVSIRCGWAFQTTIAEGDRFAQLVVSTQAAVSPDSPRQLFSRADVEAAAPTGILLELPTAL